MFLLQWRHNERDGVSNHQPHDCLLSRLFRHRSKKTSKPRVTGLCAGNSPVTGEFPAQRACDAENVSIGWRHHVLWSGPHSSSQINFSSSMDTYHMYRKVWEEMANPFPKFVWVVRKQSYNTSQESRTGITRSSAFFWPGVLFINMDCL